MWYRTWLLAIFTCGLLNFVKARAVINLFEKCVIQWKFEKFNEKLFLRFSVLQSNILQPSLNNSLIKNLQVYGNHLFTKFSLCSVMFYQIDLKTVPVIPSYNGDPSFVIFFAKNYSEYNSLRIAASYQYNLSTSAVQIFMAYETPNSYSLRLICSVCQSTTDTFIPLENVNFRLILLQWKFLHSNLFGYSVLTFGPRGAQSLRNKCSGAQPGSSGPCTRHFLQTSFNMTLANSKSGSLQENDVLSSAILNEAFMNFTKTIGNRRFATPNPGIDIQMFSLLIVVRRNNHQNDLQAVAQPFDQYVWQSIFFVLLITPLAQSLISKVNKSSVKLNYLTWTFLHFSSLAGQCHDSVRKYFTSHQSLALWIIWNFVGLIISNAFDGKLYSYLASDRQITTPDSLEQLANSLSYPVITVGTIINFRDNGTREPKSRLANLFQTTGTAYKVPSYYQKLSKRIRFFTFYQKHILELLIEVFTHVHQKRSGKVRAFAFADETKNVDLFYSCFDLSDTWKVVKKREIPNFSSFQGWVVRKFFLQRLFEFVLWQTLESGLKHFWNRNNGRKVQKGIIQALQSDHVAINAKINRQYNPIGYVNQDLKHVKRKDKVDPTPLSLDQIDDLLIFCNGMLAVAGIIACFEFIWHNFPCLGLINKVKSGQLSDSISRCCWPSKLKKRGSAIKTVRRLLRMKIL